MEMPKAVGWTKGYRNALVVVAFILLLAGGDLLLNRPEGAGVQWFSVPFLAAGLGILALIAWPTAKPGPRPPTDTLARRLLHWASWDGRLVTVFPVFGIVVIVADLAYNTYASASP